jgi:uroporphyrinogen decarboxylase
VEFRLCPSLREEYRQRYGDTQSFQDHFAFPLRFVNPPLIPSTTSVDWMPYYPSGVKEGTTFIAEWGIAMEPGSVDAKHMRHMRHPMAHLETLEEIQQYPYPDYTQADYATVARESDEFKARGLASIASMDCTVWEYAWYLRSMEELMMDMASEDEKAIYLLDKITEQSCIRAAKFAEIGLDMLLLGDDVGMQSTLMMSLDFYREWLKPRLAKIIQSAKTIKPDIIIAYHTCGFVTPVINDLIEAGVEVLNPVQPECMDFAEVHAEFGDRLSFWGTIGTQTTMPYGTPDDVRAMVFRNLKIAGDKGGLLCTPTHMLEPEVPWENIEAYAATCRDYRG